MKRVGNNQWPLMCDASLDCGRPSEKWPRLELEQFSDRLFLLFIPVFKH